jgi:hypothetical protein
LADTEEGTFDFREYGVNASTALTDRFRVGLQVFGRKFGNYGDDKIILDWGYADFRFQDWFGVRAGRMKIALGLYNETRDIDIVRTSMLLPESIYNDAWRETVTALNGGGVYGSFSGEKFGTLSYQGQVGDVTLDPDGGMGKYLNEFVPMDIQELETSVLYNAGLEWVPAPPLDGLRLRWTWNLCEIDAEAITDVGPLWVRQGVPPGLPLSYHAELNVMTLSAEITWGDLVLAAEMFTPDNYANSLTSPILGTVFDDEPDKVGYYASAAYGITDWFEVGLAYSEFYNNGDDKDGERLNLLHGYPKYNAWLKDTTLTTRFDIREAWVLKLEGHFMNGTDIMLTADNPDGTKEDWMLFGAKITYNF